MSDTESILEEASTVLDSVVLGALVVWVGIHSEEVAVVNDSLVRSIDPGSPCIDVTNWNTAQSGSSNQGSDALDIVDDGSGFSPNV